MISFWSSNDNEVNEDLEDFSLLTPLLSFDERVY